MPGYSISDCVTKDFDAFDFETGKKEKTRVEGHRTKLTDRVEDRSKEPSALAIVRNYENAIKSVQGTDSVGPLEANMKLSQARAEAVVQALTRSQGVAATRYY